MGAKQFFFGAGSLYGLDATGNPLKFGTLQDVSVEFSGDIKELYGSLQFPAHIGRGKSKITCKAKSGEIHGALLAALYFGLSKSAGEILAAQNEPWAIPLTPFKVTPVNQAHFSQDLGVRLAADGLPLTAVAASPGPTTGEYSVDSTGVYTFAAADTGKNVLIDYLYTASATGSTIAITNQPMGSTPSFKAILTGITDGKTMTLILYKCVSSKLTLPTKNEDHLVVEFDFSAQADDNDQIGTLTVTE